MPGPMGGPGRPGMNTQAKAKNFKATTKKLINNYLSKYKLAITIVIIFAIGSTIFSIVGPKILGNATTEIFNGIISKLSGGSGIDYSKILKILLTLLGLYVISALFSLIQGFTMTSVAQKLTYKIRNDIAQKINKLPMKYFDKKTNGEVLSIITNDIDTLSQNLNQSITQIITSICTIIGILVMMLSISVTMTIASLIILPISTVIVKKIVTKSQKYFQKQQAYLGHVNGQVEEVYGGHTIVKAFNGEQQEIEKFEKANKELYSSGWKSQFLSGLMHPVMNFIGNVGYVVVAVLGGYLAVQGKITVGNIQSFIQYNKQFTQPIMQIAQVSGMLQSMVAAAERVFEFLEEPEEVEENDKGIDTSKLKGNIEFKNVKFGYNDDKIIIKDFNANVKEGQKIAIVGPTGCGKTTLINLLMRFYDLNSGKILIDQKDITDVNRTSLRKSFGMVLQDTWIKKGTIRENIKLGKPEATDEDVIQAAKSAMAYNFIKRLPEGFETVVENNDSILSEGERQLISIARVMLLDPPMLILDEATSNIDTRTEQKVQKAFAKLMKGRTSFVVAHRLSTIVSADIILVMKNGKIIEKGKHQELLESGGFYAKLYNSQYKIC